MAERPPNEPVETDDGRSHEADRSGEDVEIPAFGRLTDRRSQSGRREDLATILHVFGDDAGVPRPANRDTSHSSRGIPLLPAMTLNRMYHCVPSNSSTTELIPRPAPTSSIPPTT